MKWREMKNGNYISAHYIIVPHGNGIAALFKWTGKLNIQVPYVYKGNILECFKRANKLYK